MENNDEIVVWAGGLDCDEEEECFVPDNPLERPDVSYVKPIIAFSVYAIQFALLIIFLPFEKWWLTLITLVSYSLIYFSVIAKKAVIWLVHLYQNKASDETRLKCVMEPSCSVYMILAVEKYGVIRGVYKGIRRLFRCGNENGIDYP